MIVYNIKLLFYKLNVSISHLFYTFEGDFMLVQFVTISTLLFVLTSPVFAVDKVIVEHDPDNPLFLKDLILAGMLSVVVPGAG